MTRASAIAILALTLFSCSREDNSLLPGEDFVMTGDVTITARLAPRHAETRAVSMGRDGSDHDIVLSDWAQGEQLAILYRKGSAYMRSDATVTQVDGTTGEAKISFTIASADLPGDGTACTIVYPLAAAKDDNTGVRDAAELLSVQDGTLNADLDVRVGEGILGITHPSLRVTAQPAAQFALFTFSLLDATGESPVSASELVITADGQDYTLTPAEAGSTFHAALPALSGKPLLFTATDTDSFSYTRSYASVTIIAGKYYQSPVELAKIKKTPTVTAPTAVTGLTCNGSAQTLVNAGSTTGGTLYYMLTTTNDRPSADAEGWTNDIPTGTHAGTYYVWTKVSGNENYNAVDVSATGVAVTLSKGTRTITVAPTSFTFTQYMVTGTLTLAKVSYPSYSHGGEGSMTSTLSVSSSNTEVVETTSSYKIISLYRRTDSAGSATVTFSVSEDDDYLAASTTMPVTLQAYAPETGVAGVALQQAHEGDMVGSDGKSYPATAQLPDGVSLVGVVVRTGSTYGTIVMRADEGRRVAAANRNNYNEDFDCYVTSLSSKTTVTWVTGTMDQYNKCYLTGGEYGWFRTLQERLTAVGGVGLIHNQSYWSSGLNNSGRYVYFQFRTSNESIRWYNNTSGNGYVRRIFMYKF